MKNNLIFIVLVGLAIMLALYLAFHLLVIALKILLYVGIVLLLVALVIKLLRDRYFKP
jgi:hypothetical protein